MTLGSGTLTGSGVLPRGFSGLCWGCKSSEGSAGLEAQDGSVTSLAGNADRHLGPMTGALILGISVGPGLLSVTVRFHEGAFKNRCSQSEHSESPGGVMRPITGLQVPECCFHHCLPIRPVTETVQIPG